jgi:hypothetical protein
MSFFSKKRFLQQFIYGETEKIIFVPKKGGGIIQIVDLVSCQLSLKGNILEESHAIKLSC